MHPIKCPHCGAPSTPGYVSPPGQFTYTCPYCRQQSLQGTPVAAPPPQAPAVIVVQAPHPGYHPAAMAHARTAATASWIIWAVVILIITLGSAGGAFWKSMSHGSSMMSKLVWDGSEPLHCSGNDDIAISGVTANFTAGSAIVAMGNCHVKCTNCKISAPTAIEASGNAQVMIVNGSVVGTSVLGDASGNARITVTGTATARGAVRQSANGKVSAPVTR